MADALAVARGPTAHDDDAGFETPGLIRRIEPPRNWQFDGPAGGLAALAGSLHRKTATVDDSQLCPLGIGFDPAKGSQQRGNLLAFVLVDLAAERLDGECSHQKTVRTVRLMIPV